MQNLFSVQVLPLLFYFKKLLETITSGDNRPSPQSDINKTHNLQQPQPKVPKQVG